MERETDFNVQLFMPLYDQTLRQYIRGHSVPLYAGSTIVKQLSSAVAYLHDCSILHRDIKPPNILVKRQPLAVGQPLVVALSDLGILQRDIATWFGPGARTANDTQNGDGVL